MNFIRLPLITECRRLFRQFHTTERTVVHALRVNQIALVLGMRAQDLGLPINLALLDRAALLHDFTKDLATRKIGHHKLAFQILKEQYPLLAEVVQAHRSKTILKPKTRPKTWEARILFLADRLTKGTQVAMLEDTFREKKRRFPKKSKRFQKIYEESYALEKKILGKLGIDADELLKLNNEPFFYDLREFLPHRLSSRRTLKRPSTHFQPQPA